MNTIDGIETDVKLVQRKSPAETYMLANGKYWCGISAGSCSGHRDLMERVSDEVRQGTLGSKHDARQRVAELKGKWCSE